MKQYADDPCGSQWFNLIRDDIKIMSEIELAYRLEDSKDKHQYYSKTTKKHYIVLSNEQHEIQELLRNALEEHVKENAKIWTKIKKFCGNILKFFRFKV